MNTENKLYNEDYEKCLLGIMLLDNTLIDVIKTKVDKCAFFNAKHHRIYEEIVNQWDRHHCVTILSLTEELQQQYTQVIVDLTTDVASTANWNFYVDKVNAYYLTRKIKDNLVNNLNNITVEGISDIVDNLASESSEYMKIKGNDNKSTKSLCIEITEEVYKASKSNKLWTGMDCGWEKLNELTDGLQTGNLYVLGARPSIGKTAAALSIMKNLCEHEVKCGFISLEMSDKSIIYRLLAMKSGLPSWQIRKGTCMTYKRGIEKFQTACSQVFNYPLNIFDKNIKNEEQIYSCIRYEAKINGVKFFCIDHLGLVKYKNQTAQRYADIGAFTAGLKDLAKELDVSILLLCQCGREAEGKEPTLALLRESGNIEQDADVIMLLHRERDADAKVIPTKLILAKNRDGGLGTVELDFYCECTKFTEHKNNFNDEVEKAPEVIVHKKEVENEAEALF